MSWLKYANYQRFQEINIVFVRKHNMQFGRLIKDTNDNFFHAGTHPPSVATWLLCVECVTPSTFSPPYHAPFKIPPPLPPQHIHTQHPPHTPTPTHTTAPYTHTHTCTHTHTRTHTHTHMQAHTHIHRHTHTFTCSMHTYSLYDNPHNQNPT